METKTLTGTSRCAEEASKRVGTIIVPSMLPCFGVGKIQISRTDWRPTRSLLPQGLLQIGCGLFPVERRILAGHPQFLRTSPPNSAPIRRHPQQPMKSEASFEWNDSCAGRRSKVTKVTKVVAADPSFPHRPQNPVKKQPIHESSLGFRRERSKLGSPNCPCFFAEKAHDRHHFPRFNL